MVKIEFLCDKHFSVNPIANRCNKVPSFPLNFKFFMNMNYKFDDGMIFWRFF